LANRLTQRIAKFTEEEWVELYNYAMGTSCPVLTDDLPQFLKFDAYHLKKHYITDRIPDVGSNDNDTEDDDREHEDVESLAEEELEEVFDVEDVSSDEEEVSDTHSDSADDAEEFAETDSDIDEVALDVDGESEIDEED